MKRRLSAILACVFLISALAACAGNNNGAGNKNNGTANVTQSPSAAPSDSGAGTEQPNTYGDTGGLTLPLVDKPTTITWMLSGESDPNGKLVAQEIEKRTGIKVNFQAFSNSTYQDKLRVTVASGKLPDIFHGLKPAELKQIGGQKAVVAINDYLDILPNFNRMYVEENPWVIKSYGDENGKMYAWPIYNMNRDVNHGLMARMDILKELGLEMWKDTDGFYEVLKAMKAAYPDSYPFASKTKELIFKDLAYGWGIAGDSYPAYYDEASKVWKFASIQPEHKELLDFIKKLYNEGLIDPEFLTDTPDSWTAKMTTDKSFVTWDWIGRLDLFYNQIKDVNPDFDLRYANPIGPTGNIRTLPKIDASWGITVANNANKEAALKLLDYLSSPSGAELVTIGAEGVNFTWDESGKATYPELSDLPTVDINVLNDRYGMWMEGMYLAPDRRSVYYNFTEKEQEAQDMMLSDNKFEPLDPVLNFTDQENARLAEIQTSLEKAAAEFNSKYVLNKAYGNSEWEAWVQNAAKIGVTEYIGIYNAAQERFDSSK
ncbi:ABC transporter substrate-binding protein [Paenibacillus agaridevorans]|jgi:putative aldouronate transport system substrate-binding protein|uniref:ABC transporter substrate-binding protein n=1 Tax=Paenibacillus agaridevorans TaxID=171404 RepID=A0A2R5F4N0_9BACL|nr:extracellular solute-binding protein [Paenibacillus agaridevorans]GBG11084.1 ABC transporter substrate-binding protein [Paenibacillus agaridevorans]